MNRLDSLDWLRGLLALSIMIYHLTAWTLYQPDSAEILGRIGIYGVSMFFILSGLSMAFVYSKYIQSLRTSFNFFVRRVFRIWPLLWLAVLAVTLGKILLNEPVNWLVVVANLTTIFGFISPGAYINTGAWSIGNEMFYYALTPALIFAFNRSLIYGNLVFAITLLIGAFFAWQIISPQETLSIQWRYYINPFNNLFLYCAGLAIYYNTHQSNYDGKVTAALFMIALAIFIYYPVSGNQVNIVTGFNRVVFSFASILMVIAFYKSKLSLHTLFSMPLTQLGLATYGVYLLHPIVFQLIAFGLKKLDVVNHPLISILLTIVVTVFVSLLSFKLLESPLIAIGKRITPHKIESNNATHAEKPAH